MNAIAIWARDDYVFIESFFDEKGGRDQ